MKRIISVILVFTTLLGLLCSCSKTNESLTEIDYSTVDSDVSVNELTSDFSESTVVEPESESVTEKTTELEVYVENPADNAINVLNYLVLLSQEIYQYRKNRLFLEEAYNTILNRINPAAIKNGDGTLDEFNDMLDTIESFRMNNVKRERLDYLYEINQAQAFKQAIPSPLSILNVVQSKNTLEMALSAIYLVIDSVSSYSAYKQEGDLQYLKDGWQLDDEEAKDIHELRKSSFNYRINIVNDYDLEGDTPINENDFDNFVKFKNNKNDDSRIVFFESTKNIYEKIGEYWIVLAESYYNVGKYKECLEAVKEYEKLNIKIFLKDYDYAKILPKAICAAKGLYKGKQYVKVVNDYAQKILDNCEYQDWALRYFVAQTYIDLYSQTKNNIYLEKAYSISKENVNYYISEQKKYNNDYVSDVKEYELSNNPTEKEKDEAKKYNKAVKEARKTELPSVREALVLNCELLFALADKLNVSKEEKATINRILNSSAGEDTFLVKPLTERFTFNNKEKSDYEIEFKGDKIILPVNMISADFVIKVTVKDKNKSTVFQDWKIQSVDRNKSKNIEDFTVELTSKKAKDYKFEKGDTFVIEILPKSNITDLKLKFEYEVVNKKILFNKVNTIEFKRKEK